ncbi:MAG: hypothetical protein ACR2HR_01420 [Euzebya sp.]
MTVSLDAGDIEVDEEAFEDVLYLRADARSRRAKSSTGDQLYRLYLLVLLGSPFAYLFVGALREAPRLSDAQIDTLGLRLSVVGPAVLLGLAVSGLRLAAWTGPVVVARADINWLFSLPLPRQRLIRPRLRRALIVAAVVGFAVGVLATLPYHVVVGLSPDAGLEVLRLGLVAGTGGALYALLLAGAGWVVETRPRLARALMRGGGLVVVASFVAAAVAAVGPLPPAWLGSVAMASGPWGWLCAAVLSVTAPPGIDLVGGVAGVLLLAVLAAVLVAVAWRRAGQVPLEELRRRSATSAQVTAAAVYFADFRSAAQARDRVVRALVGRSRRRLPMPGRAWLLVPWLGSTVLLRQPRRMGQALLWLTGGIWLVVQGLKALVDSAQSEPTSRLVALIPLGVVVAYPAAGTLIEPLRVEIEQRFGIRMLRDPLTVIGLQHLVTPAVILWLLGMIAAGILAGAGLIPVVAAVAAPGALLLAAPTLILAAAFVASGPPADSMWLYSGDSGLGRLAFHLLRGPLLAGVAVGVPILISGGSLAQPGAIGVATVSWTVWTLALGYGLGQWVRTRLQTHH